MREKEKNKFRCYLQLLQQLTILLCHCHSTVGNTSSRRYLRRNLLRQYLLPCNLPESDLHQHGTFYTNTSCTGTSESDLIVCAIPCCIPRLCTESLRKALGATDAWREFPFHFGGLELVFAKNCVYVRNSSQPSATVCNRSQPFARWFIRVCTGGGTVSDLWRRAIMLTFAEEVSVCAVRVSHKCQVRMSDKSVKYECHTRVSSKSDLQKCQV